MGDGNSRADMRLISTRLDYVEKSIAKEECILEKRLEAMNEFRQALKDQNGTFITRTEFNAKHLLLEEKIAALEKRVYIGIGIAVVFEVALRFVK